MTKSRSQNDYIAYVVGYSEHTNQTEKSKFKRQNVHLYQDFDRAEITGNLDKPIILLFGKENVLVNPSNSDIVEIQFKNGPRYWKWYERRVFETHNEVINALQFPSFIHIDQKNSQGIGKILASSTAIRHRIDRAFTNTSEISQRQKLFQLLFQYFLGKGSTISDELKAIASDNSIDSQLRAIALNILADYYTTRNRLDKTIDVAEKSIQLVTNQIAAYILSSNAYKLIGQKEESFKRINQIPKELSSNLMIDIQIDKTSCLLMQLSASDQINNAEYSYEIASTLFSTLIQNESSDLKNIELIDRLIVDSISYDKLQDARIFLNYLLQKLLDAPESESNWFKIDELMSFFIEKQDYEFAISIYEKFFDLNIQPNLSRRRLVALLIKTNRLNEARELSVNSKAFFT